MSGDATGVDFWLDGAEAHAGLRGSCASRGSRRLSADFAALRDRPGQIGCRKTAFRLYATFRESAENLQDHLQIRAVYKLKNAKTLNERANSFMGKVGMGLEYILFKRGPMTMAPSQLGVFTKSDEHLETPNLQYHVQPLSLDKFGEPLHPFPAITASVCNLRPESRGYIRITSPDPRSAGNKPNYLTADTDRQIAANALKLTRKITSSPAMSKYEPEEYLPGPTVASDEDLTSRRRRYCDHDFSPRWHVQNGIRRFRGS